MNPPTPRSTLGRCRECGIALSQEAGDGFCPACAIEGALRLGGCEPTGDDQSPGKYVQACIGPYDLLEEIGRGGMGMVYRAHQQRLNRIVAVKMILTGQFAGKHEVLRFRAEAEMAAKLTHPNIVAVYESGEHQGQHYFSMEFVQGRNLSDIVRTGGALPAKRAAAYAESIAKAIDYAHQQGVLHRDLKPSNVLIDAEDRPRITDFGLARHLRDDFGVTVTGQLLGSPNYMPPEQVVQTGNAEFRVRGDVSNPEANAESATGNGASQFEGEQSRPKGNESENGARADEPSVPAVARRVKPGPTVDVYGIGAILYHSLTGRAPFEAASIQDVLLQLRESEPVALRRLNPSVPRDLETICLKCLEKEPARRYQSAQELADELGHFLKEEPIAARPVSPAERAWRWCRRKPALATLGAIALVLMAVVLLGGPIAIALIERAKQETERNLYAADMKLVSEAVRTGAYNYARELLERHRPVKVHRDLRGFEWFHFWKHIEDHQPVRTLTGLPATTGWQDGSLSIRGNVLYNKSGNELRAWETTHWQSLTLAKPHKPDWVQWAWFPGAEIGLAVDSTNATVTVYHLPEFTGGSFFHCGGTVTQTGASEDAKLLGAAVLDHGKHRLFVWDLQASKLLGACGSYDSEIEEIAFSPHDKTVAASCSDGELAIWDLNGLTTRPSPPKGIHRRLLRFFPDDDRVLFFDDTRQQFYIWTISAHTAIGVDQVLGFTPDGNYLITSGNRRDLSLLDVHTFQAAGIFRGHFGLARGMGFSPDGKLIATASVDQTARIWELATQREVGLLGGFGERISDVKFSADGQSIILVTGFGAVKVYDRAAVVNRGLFALSADEGGVASVAMSSDNRTMASRGVSGIVSTWNLADRTEVLSVTNRNASLGNLAFSPDGSTIAWADHEALRFLSVKSGEVESIPLAGNVDRGDVAFSPDGKELAYGCRTQLMVMDVQSRHSHAFANDEDEVFVMNYSPDGNLLAFGDRLGTLTLCNHASGRVLCRTNAHPPHVYAVEFSPNGRILASCGADSSIKLWTVNAEGLSLRATLRGHMGYISCIAFSPDGTRLVSAAGDQSLKLWDTAQPAEVATLYGHTDYARSAKFSKDGRTIYSSGFGADRQIRFYQANPVGARLRFHSDGGSSK